MLLGYMNQFYHSICCSTLYSSNMCANVMECFAVIIAESWLNQQLNHELSPAEKFRVQSHPVPIIILPVVQSQRYEPAFIL